MFNQWAGALITAQKPGAALTNTVTATSLLPSGAQFNFPSNYWQIGTRIRVTAAGILSTAASAPGTLTLDFRVGGTVMASAVTGTVVTSLTNVAWDLHFDLTLQAIGNGTGANFYANGKLLTTAQSAATPIVLASGTAVTSGFNSTGSNYLDVFGTWSVASASNTITLQQFMVEMLN